MIEKKKFVEDRGYLRFVFDTEREKHLYLDEVVDLLNELNEEKEQLKQQLKTKHIVNKQYEELQRLKKDNKELKKENERLQRELDDCEKIRYSIFEKMNELNYIQSDAVTLKKHEELFDDE